MKVARGQIASALTAQLASSNTDSKSLASSVAAYLLEQRRTGELDSLMRDVMEARSNQGIVEVTAVSAHPLDERATADVKAEVKTLFPDAHEVIVSPRLEPALIGGIRLEFANAQLDLSLKAKLNRMRQLITYGKDQ